MRKYREGFKEYNEGGDDEGNGRLSSSRDLVETIYRCYKLMYRGETSPMVNSTYFIIHSQDTIYNFMYWNEMDQYNIKKVNEMIERISNITGDKYDEKRDSLPHIEYRDKCRINKNENENERIKDKSEL